MVGILNGILYPLMVANSFLLRLGRTIAWVALGVMVLVILAQVFFRYVLNNALPWPDEAARFLMLWMTGLIAPLAYRHGGFVAIEFIPDMMTPTVYRIFTLALLVIMAVVLVLAVRLGWDHTMGFGGNFNSSSLRLPLDLIGLEQVRVKLRYMYASLLVCFIMLLSVNVELILRTLVEIAQGDKMPPPPGDPAVNQIAVD